MTGDGSVSSCDNRGRVCIFDEISKIRFCNEGVNAMIFHVPHSSRIIPPSGRSAILLSDSELEAELTAMTDAYTDELFGACARDEDVSVCFPVSRLVVDPERFVDDELEAMAERGMGVVYTRTSKQECLRGAPDQQEKQRMIRAYYDPHHENLTKAVTAELEESETALIVDCHSFPSAPLPYEPDQDPERPDICIGTDDFHTMPELVDALMVKAAALDFHAKINRPFAGTMVPGCYYQIDARVQSVMIEINRALYMDEQSGKKSADYGVTQSNLKALIEALRIEWIDLRSRDKDTTGLFISH